MTQPNPKTTTKEHDVLIRHVIDVAAVKARSDHGWVPVEKRTPLDELLAREEGESPEEAQVRMEAFHKLLEYFFQKGPHPAQAMQLLYAVAKALRPDLILHMTVRDLGRIFGDTPAAWSWRIEQCISKFIGRAGMRGVRLPCQKSEAARESYRAAQRGNKNRAGLPKARSRKSLPVAPSTDLNE